MLDSIHMTSSESRIAHGLTMLSEKKMKNKVLEGQVRVEESAKK